MSDIIQWAIIAAAILVSSLVLVRKFRRQSKGTCDGCCEGCKMRSAACDDITRKPS